MCLRKMIWSAECCCIDILFLLVLDVHHVVSLEVFLRKHHNCSSAGIDGLKLRDCAQSSPIFYQRINL
uniref:Putative secreted protein n=1 Tax=Rhipicephalus microplus TaxID=6941 RepID=A0A6M2DBV4_RHIMP